jgi:hypothetical protein
MRHPFPLKKQLVNPEYKTTKFTSDFITNSQLKRIKHLKHAGLDDVIYKLIPAQEFDEHGFKLISDDPLCAFYGNFWKTTSGLNIPENIQEDKIWYSKELDIYIILEDSYVVLEDGELTKIGDPSDTPLQILNLYVDHIVNRTKFI